MFSFEVWHHSAVTPVLTSDMHLSGHRFYDRFYVVRTASAASTAVRASQPHRYRLRCLCRAVACAVYLA